MQLSGVGRVTQSLCLPYMTGRVFFSRLCFTHDMVNSKSVMGIKCYNSGVMIGYQVDEFTCTWSAEHFAAWSHIYPAFIDKVSTLAHFPIKPGCKDYFFLDEAVKDFEFDLHSNLMDSVDTSELDASFDENDAMPSSVSSRFLHTVPFLTILDCSLLLASNLINYGASLEPYFLPVPQSDKTSASKLIHFLFSLPAAFGLQAFLPPENITLNPVNKKSDWSYADFQTGIGAALLRFKAFRTVLCLNGLVTQKQLIF